MNIIIFSSGEYNNSQLSDIISQKYPECKIRFIKEPSSVKSSLGILENTELVVTTGYWYEIPIVCDIIHVARISRIKVANILSFAQ